MRNLRRVLIASVAPLVVSALMPAAAQDDSTDEAARRRDQFDQTDVIIVTGTPIRQQTFTAPADVDVLAGADLREQRAAGLGQTLDALPGVNVVATGEQAGNPVIRGLSGNRVKVLSNGVGLNFQQFGVRHPPNLDPFLADRIEIVRGPASLQYGSDALGGAINVIPAPPPRAENGEAMIGGEAHVGFSSAHEMIEGAYTMKAAAGRFGLIGTFVGRDADGLNTPDIATAFESGDNTAPLVSGELPFTDFAHINGDLSVGYYGDGVELIARWETYNNRQNYLIPDPGMPVQPGGIGQKLENDLVQTSARIELGRGVTLSPQFTFVRNVRRANRGGADPVPLPVPDGLANVNIVRDAYTSRIVAEHGSIFGLAGQVGVEYVFEEQESLGPSRITPGGEVHNAAIFLFEAFEAGRFKLNFGLRHEQRDQRADPARTAVLGGLPTDDALLDRDFSATTGGVGVSYQLTDNFVAAASVRTAFRAPTLFELYAFGMHNGVAAIQQGDPTLSEEEAISYDASFRWRSDKLEISATGYVTDFDNFITLIGTGRRHPVSNMPIFQMFEDEALLYGGDVEAIWRPLDGLELRGVFEIVRGSFDEMGDDLPLLPADNFQFEARRTFTQVGAFEDVYGSVGVRYARAKDAAGPLEPFYQFDLPQSRFGVASTDSYVLADIAVGARLGDASFRIEATNLFDKAYQDFLDTYKTIALSPGRDIRLSASIAF